MREEDNTDFYRDKTLEIIFVMIIVGSFIKVSEKSAIVL